MSDKNAPQFETAEYVGLSGSDRCSACQQPISGQYFRVNGQMACSTCAEQARASVPRDSHAAFVRGVLFGVGAAIVGLVLYATVGIVTGLMIGYVSLAVGYLVGKAMMKGSGGLGGRRYQVTAALLTYAAVSLAAIPIGISQYISAKKENDKVQVQTQQPSTNSQASEPAGDTESAQLQETNNAEPATPSSSVSSVIGSLALLGLASPFLELESPVHGLIGLFILFIGIQIAWKITAGHPPTEVTGPF